MKIKPMIRFLFSIWLPVACQNVATSSNITATTDQEFTFAPGQSAVITDADLTITFKSILSDDRCPREVEIPVSMQCAMAREAEATREKRARIIKAEAELESSEKLAQGAQRIPESPMALELRRMQMISKVGAEQNAPFPAATATAAAR